MKCHLVISSKIFKKDAVKLVQKIKHFLQKTCGKTFYDSVVFSLKQALIALVNWKTNYKFIGNSLLTLSFSIINLQRITDK